MSNCTLAIKYDGLDTLPSAPSPSNFLHPPLVSNVNVNREFIREQTIIGSVSYRNRYWAYRRIGYFCMADTSLQVQQLLTSRITQDDQRAFVTRHSLHANAID